MTANRKFSLFCFLSANDDSDRLTDFIVHQFQIPQSLQQLLPFAFHGATRQLGGNLPSMFSAVDEMDGKLPAGVAAGPIMMVVHSESSS
jgi:hypothetical protein